jgi:hypothetical protein
MNFAFPVATAALYLTSSAKYETKVTSSICAAFIVLATWTRTHFGLTSFLVYLALDLFAGKSIDIVVHHVVAFVLSFLGYILLLKDNGLIPNTIVENTVIRLLFMEITTPVLNLAKYLHAQKSKMTELVFAVLLILWLIFRILGPVMCLMELYKLLYYGYGLSFQTIYASISVLFVLQCYWLVKLVRMAF